jgi:magnesium-transporting ATPase (P-type)
VLQELDSRVDGLSVEAAQVRLQEEGPNLLPAPSGSGVPRMLARQLVHFFALMLWAAAALALFAGAPQLSAAIVLVIVVNAIFSFAQEFRAGRAVRALSALMPSSVTVVRDGRQAVVPAAELVRGDVVLLREGDHVPVDARLLRSDGLTVDDSTLTGESVPVVKVVSLPGPPPAEPIEAGTIVFAGTFVGSGSCTAVAVATGAGTRLGAIARLTGQVHRRRTPLERELNRAVVVIALFAVSVGAVFLAVSTAVGMDLRPGLTFSVGVLVALVPEGLLPTLTLALATSAGRLARRRVVVRRLEAVETLGSTTVICTDKTGTLTANQMTARVVVVPGRRFEVSGTGYDSAGGVSARDRPANDAELASLQRLLLAAALCGNARIERRDGRPRCVGDPTEGALVVLAAKGGVERDAAERRRPRVREFPFDSRRRRMSTLHAQPDGRYLLLVKGGPEAVLAACDSVATDGGSEPLTDQWRTRMAAEEEALAGQGLRMLALAEREVGSPDVATADDAERELTLLGVVGLADPVRPEVPAAVARCREAGIRVVMITGDHPTTALTVARRAGLAEGRLLLGTELPADDDELLALLADTTILARTAPEQKLRVTRLLQARSEVVAVTGDGVNDAPALRRADIGVAMGASGTDVARAAADMVLLDDNFAHLVEAIEEGRAAFANIRRFLTYHLTDNVAELAPFAVWGLSFGAVPLTLTVLQVLALDIGTDILPALGLGIEAAEPGIMSQPPRSRRARLLDVRVLGRAFGFLGPVEAVTSMAVMLVSAALFLGWRPGGALPAGGPGLATLSTTLFAAIVLLQMANAFQCRSTSASVFQMPPLSNRFLVVAVASEAALLLALVYFPPLSGLLGQRPLTGHQWLPILLAPLVLVAAEDVRKLVARRRR